MLPDAADPHLPHVLAAREKDEDTDIGQFLDLVRAVCLQHIAACAEASIARGVALPPGSDEVKDAAAWLTEIRPESEALIARRISEGLRIGLARIEAEAAEEKERAARKQEAAAGSGPKRRKTAKSICGGVQHG